MTQEVTHPQVDFSKKLLMNFKISSLKLILLSKFVYGQFSTSEEKELTTEMSISVDISSLESEEESSTSTTTFRSLFSSETTTTNWPNFLPKPEDVYEDYYEDQKNEELNEHGEDLSNSNEDLLLTFQSGFMPTPPQRKKSNKNKTASIDDEGKITRICTYERWT